MPTDPVNAAPSRAHGWWTAQLPKDLAAVRTARAVVERSLRGVEAQLLGDARSVVTELVSNAVRYGQPPITLSLTFDGDDLRIEVSDAGANTWARPDEGDGWGLRIVGQLAESWGVDEASSRVWCRLARRRPQR